MSIPRARPARVLGENEPEILEAWVDGQLTDPRIDLSAIGRSELARQCTRLVRALVDDAEDGRWPIEADVSAFPGVLAALEETHRSRERHGLHASDTAISLLLLKDHLLPHLQDAYGEDPGLLHDAVTSASWVVDTLALSTYAQLVGRREATITQQAEELLEISTPVFPVWSGVVAAPLIGTLDSERTQRFMERLLERIVEANAPVALVDITGVPAIDTQTAQHLIDTINAVKLLGSRVILTGVRPSIAQTLVHLGINLSDVRTQSSFADGLRVAIETLELETTPVDAGSDA